MNDGSDAMNREKALERAALLLTVVTLVGIPFAVLGYQHHRVAREAAGAQVVELYASAQSGVWSERPLRAWDSFFRHPRKQPIRIRAGRPTLLRLTSVDVHHSFSIPQLRVPAQDVTPGRWTEIRLEPQDPGSYTVLCYTVCGGKHSTMDAELLVF
jgi:Cytochrome C oxidase subunit II, periplasmic domain